MRLVRPDKFTDVIDVGVFGENVFFAGKVTDLCRNRDDFHTRKFMQAFTHRFDIHIGRKFHAVGLHRFQHVVDLVIDRTVERLLARYTRREHAEIAFKRQETVLDHVIERSAAIPFIGVRQNLSIGNHAPAQVIVVSFFLFNT